MKEYWHRLSSWVDSNVSPLLKTRAAQDIARSAKNSSYQVAEGFLPLDTSAPRIISNTQRTRPIFNRVLLSNLLFFVEPIFLFEMSKQMLKDYDDDFAGSYQEQALDLSAFFVFSYLYVHRWVAQKMLDLCMAEATSRENPQSKYITACDHSMNAKKSQKEIIEKPQTINTMPLLANIESIFFYGGKKAMVFIIRKTLGEFAALPFDILADGETLLEFRLSSLCDHHRQEILSKNTFYSAGIGGSLHLGFFLIKYFMPVEEDSYIDSYKKGIILSTLFMTWMFLVLSIDKPLPNKGIGMDVFRESRLVTQSLLRRIVEFGVFLNDYFQQGMIPSKSETENMFQFELLDKHDKKASDELFSEIEATGMVKSVVEELVESFESQDEDNVQPLVNEITVEVKPIDTPVEEVPVPVEGFRVRRLEENFAVQEGYVKPPLSWREIEAAIFNFHWQIPLFNYQIFPAKLILGEFANSYNFNTFYEFLLECTKTPTMQLALDVYGEDIQSGLEKAIVWQQWRYTKKIHGILPYIPDWLLSEQLRERKPAIAFGLAMLFTKGVDVVLKESNRFISQARIKEVKRSESMTWSDEHFKSTQKSRQEIRAEAMNSTWTNAKKEGTPGGLKKLSTFQEPTTQASSTKQPKPGTLYLTKKPK